MAGRAVPILLSAVLGVGLGVFATALLTGGPARPPESTPAFSSPSAPLAAPTEAAATSLEESAARQALAARLRNPDALRFDEIRVWRFGPADERAVCGTMRTPEIAGGSARFVVRVLQPRGGDAAAGSRQWQTVVEDAPWLVRPTPEAARRFCREPEPEPQAAPPAAQAAGVPTAAMPVAPPRQADASPPPPADGTRGRVTTHSPANLRAAPGGEVLGSIPRGRSLVVFERTAGGWVRVGESAPEGWIHSSLLTDAPP